jgi:hypothetical protein
MRGEIVVERLTGKRAIVIHMASAEEVTCRFADGRLEERFTFELEPPLSPFGSLLAFFLGGFLSQFRLGPSAPGPAQLRLVRQPGST